MSASPSVDKPADTQQQQFNKHVSKAIEGSLSMAVAIQGSATHAPHDWNLRQAAPLVASQPKPPHCVSRHRAPAPRRLADAGQQAASRRLEGKVRALTSHPCLRYLCSPLTAPQPRHLTRSASWGGSAHAMHTCRLFSRGVVPGWHHSDLLWSTCSVLATAPAERSDQHQQCPVQIYVSHLWSMPFTACVCNASTSSSARPSNTSPTATLRQ